MKVEMDDGNEVRQEGLLNSYFKKIEIVHAPVQEVPLTP